MNVKVTKRSKKILASLSFASVLVLAGCAQSPAPIIDANGAFGPSSGNAGGVDMGSGFSSQEIAQMVNNSDQYSSEQKQKISNDIAQVMQSDNGKGNTLYFGFNQYTLSSDAKQKADAVAKILIKFPNQTIQVAGNADSIGSDNYNFSLGQKRATAVDDYLRAQGVSPSQVCTVSYGSTRSVVDAATMANSKCELVAGKPTATYACKQAYQTDRRSVVVFGGSCSGAM
jgi:peptidoglycan-associated lipoprotein